jgi:hypothetical protein
MKQKNNYIKTIGQAHENYLINLKPFLFRNGILCGRGAKWS